MNAASIKKQVDEYLPLLSHKQQALVLEMIKNFLDSDADFNRIDKKQYNKELNDAISRIENGDFISHEDVVEEISKW